MAPAPLITLLSDFGQRDGYVGAMKGVIATLAPDARVIDLTHEIAPHDVREGGIAWAAATRWFPRGTVHAAIVDPGVGSRRRILAARLRGSVYLAPDNGLLGYLGPRREVEELRVVSRREHWLRPLSRTFHGRDIFAPVAARLASGLELRELGPIARTAEWSGLPEPRRRASGAALEIVGEVIAVDRFGNAVTNIAPPGPRARLAHLEAAGIELRSLRASYAAAGEGRPLAIVGSAGLIEIAVSRGSARETLGLGIGARVATEWRVASGSRRRRR